MAYKSETIAGAIIENFENVKLRFMLRRDEDLQENQIEITAYVYCVGTEAANYKEKPVKTVAIRVDYAEILANYYPEMNLFHPVLIDEIFCALNAELAPHKYQLKFEIKNPIRETLKQYIPKEELPSGTGT